MSETTVTPPVELPENIAVLIEIDTEFRAADMYASGNDADDAEYVRQHNDGELCAYVVSLVDVNDDDRNPFPLANIGGVDSKHIGIDGWYTTIASIPDEYIRDSIVPDLITELPAPQADAPTGEQPDVPALRIISAERLAAGDMFWGHVEDGSHLSLELKAMKVLAVSPADDYLTRVVLEIPEDDRVPDITGEADTEEVTQFNRGTQVAIEFKAHPLAVR